ncbi:aminotransferase class IV [Deinococcus roseus]|uniref:4-amino-4-deoxychorismate lyase n=1 Tax=Deinococcus roseus TaxID=392414 RepID=A0ABQ2CVR3_9DEIO|nr:aminotransferase class IV [Deinococcus roseus]GGJ25556.1 4-amino-4-deoxychorismate lyase [Deinococcus roseus]
MRLLPSEQVQSLGHCLYTTLRLHEHQLLYWEKHLERLNQSIQHFGFPEILDAQDLKAWIEHQSPAQGLCRITLTEQDVLVSFRDFRPIPEHISVVLTDQVVHPVMGLHKTGNHLPYTLAARETQLAGAFEGLLWDASQRFVTDGTRAGFLLKKDDIYITPLGGLPSVTRQVALQELGVQARTQWVTREDLFAADQLWLCGSGLGVLPVQTLKHQEEERTFASSPLAVRSVGLIPPQAPENH